MQAHRSLLFLSLVLGLSSCGFVKRNTIGLITGNDYREEQPLPAKPVRAKPVNEPAVVDVEKLKTERARTNVEVTWLAPQDVVDGFLLRYGFSPGDMSHEVRVDQKKLAPIEDPDRGTLYRYTLEKIPEGKKVYVTVSSYRGSLVSPPSEAIAEQVGADD